MCVCVKMCLLSAHTDAKGSKEITPPVTIHVRLHVTPLSVFSFNAT